MVISTLARYYCDTTCQRMYNRALPGLEPVNPTFWLVLWPLKYNGISSLENVLLYLLLTSTNKCITILWLWLPTNIFKENKFTQNNFTYLDFEKVDTCTLRNNRKLYRSYPVTLNLLHFSSFPYIINYTF